MIFDNIENLIGDSGHLKSYTVTRYNDNNKVGWRITIMYPIVDFDALTLEDAVLAVETQLQALVNAKNNV